MYNCAAMWEIPEIRYTPINQCKRNRFGARAASSHGGDTVGGGRRTQCLHILELEHDSLPLSHNRPQGCRAPQLQ